MPNTLFARCLWTVICFAIALQSAWASEGFWLLNRLPLDAIENDTGIRLESNWISRALRSTLRTPGWRTSSFISPAGLVLTNHHCLVACLSQNSASHNYLEQGFLAQNGAAELPCSETELDQIINVSDVTEQISQTLSTVSVDDYGRAKQRAIANIES